MRLLRKQTMKLLRTQYYGHTNDWWFAAENKHSRDNEVAFNTWSSFF